MFMLIFNTKRYLSYMMSVNDPSFIIIINNYLSLIEISLSMMSHHCNDDSSYATHIMRVLFFSNTYNIGPIIYRSYIKLINRRNGLLIMIKLLTMAIPLLRIVYDTMLWLIVHQHSRVSSVFGQLFKIIDNFIIKLRIVRSIHQVSV